MRPIIPYKKKQAADASRQVGKQWLSLEETEQQERQSAILERWTEEKDMAQRISRLSVFKTFDGEKQAWMEYVEQSEQHFEVNGICDCVARVKKLTTGRAFQELTCEDLILELDNHFGEKIHQVAQRYRFSQLRKRSEQTHLEWITELRGCERGRNFFNSRIRDELTAANDRIILNTPSTALMPSISLEELSRMAEGLELAEQTAKLIENDEVKPAVVSEEIAEVPYEDV
ncbi:hypothetical protein ACOME3_009380 [Neoechinorhynchus agilis]